MYESFAEVYDTLMDDVDYDAWADRYAMLLEDAGIRSGRVCECACGTGSLTVRLAQRGYQMTGVDISASMLRVAELRCRQQGVQCSLVRQDMRHLTLPRKVAAVLCTCDGLNYLTDPKGVLEFFSAASAALCPGGALIMDFSTREKLEQEGDAFYGEERDGLCYLWQNRMNPDTRILSMDMTFFVREEDGRYRRFREEQRQRAHDVREVRSWLAQSGFDLIEEKDAAWFSQVRSGDERLHLCARLNRKD